MGNDMLSERRTFTLAATRRRYVTRAARLLAAGGILPAAAACGTGTASQDTGTTAKGPVKIRLATDWLSGARGDTMKVALDLWRQQQPLIEVVVESITGDYYTAVNTQLAAGTIQEVLLFEGNFFYSFKDQGAFTAVDESLKKLKVNMADYTLVPGIYQDKGKQYGMPFQLVCSGWFYNVALFQERGVKPPADTWTWDDAQAAAQALTAPDKQQYGLMVSNSSQFSWGPLLFSAGARWHNADKTKTLLADQGGLDAFQWVIDLIYKYRVSPAPAQVAEVRGAAASPFAAGKVGMLTGGLQSVGNMVAQVQGRFPWAIMPTPKHPKTKKATQVWNDQPHVLTNAAKKGNVVDQATQLIVFLAGEAAQGRVAVDRGSIPVLKRLQTAGDFLKSPPDGMKQVSANLADPDIQTPGYIKGWDEWMKAINDEVGKAFAGDVAATQALRNAVTAADAVLARTGPQR
jgi:multiple sugar transport system substrate-binding protein